MTFPTLYKALFNFIQFFDKSFQKKKKFPLVTLMPCLTSSHYNFETRKYILK